MFMNNNFIHIFLKGKVKKLTKISRGDTVYQQILKKMLGYFPVISLTLEDKRLTP